MRYHARFYGRRIHAIGIFYWIETTTQGETEEAARLALYDRYEHIAQLVLTPIVAGQEGSK